MVALIVVVTFVVVLLGVLVAGLLRSHADILRSLHELGVGVGDPAGKPGAVRAQGIDARLPTLGGITPSLRPAATVAGVTPSGDARAIAVNNSDGLTLLAFLSAGCATCAGFWKALQTPADLDLPGETRIAIVTKGPEREMPTEVASLETGGVPVVMSTEAWLDYEVPASPFFVLIDGATDTVVGRGVAAHTSQLVDLIGRAEHDRGTSHRRRRRIRTASSGPAREADADAVLEMAGILPGDPSLYPQTLDDVFPFGTATTADSDGGSAVQAD